MLELQNGTKTNDKHVKYSYQYAQIKQQVG
jgi:hypothetical protein